MKLFSGFVLSCFVAVFVIVGCSGSSTYSDLVKTQKATISTFLRYDTINVINSLPSNYATKAWAGKKDYYLSSTGLYYHLLQVGDQAAIDSKDSIRVGDNVVVRYIKIGITLPPDTVESTWTTLNSAYPSSITYGSTGSEPSAWQEAITYMKYSGAQAELIVPGTLGTSTDQSNVTPYYYKLSIKKLPR
jgi:hypothetical protein